MDLGWGNPKAKNFVTTVGLITSDGPNGPNIMAAEWTFYVSYSPALISVHVGKRGKATEENIRATREFGVSITADDQNVVSSIAGGSTGKEVDKIGMLRELGTKFYKAKKIGVLMVEGAAMNAECRLLETHDVGDHYMHVGEVVEIDSHEKTPVAYHDNKYWKLGEQLQRPGQDVLDKIEQLKIKYAKKK